MTDAGVEQYVRDARIISIYEGTSGIQAMDLMRRKLIGDGGGRYRLLTELIRNDLDANNDMAVAAIREATQEGLTSLDAVTERLLETAADQEYRSLAVATDYLHLLGLVTGAWMWLRMAAATGSSALHKEKRAVAEFYGTWVMAEVPMRVARINNDAAFGQIFGKAIAAYDYYDLALPIADPKPVRFRKSIGTIMARILIPVGAIQDW